MSSETLRMVLAAINQLPDDDLIAVCMWSKKFVIDRCGGDKNVLDKLEKSFLEFHENEDKLNG